MSATLHASGPAGANPIQQPADAGGFFAHHGLWAPGVRLFRCLRFAAKAAVIVLSHALADEVAPQGVRVNVISPGGIGRFAIVSRSRAAAPRVRRTWLTGTSTPPGSGPIGATFG